MNKKWHNQGRSESQRIDAGLKKVKLPFRKRVDVIWFSLFFSAFVLFIVGWLVTVVLGHRFGLFDDAALRPIHDPRMLTNIHRDIARKPILDAVMHLPEKALFLSQAGGGVHRYQPATGLWKTETPFSEVDDSGNRGLNINLETGLVMSGDAGPLLLNPDITLLRSGCGTDPLSNRVQACWDMESLWGLTAGGGLVRRKNGHWDLVKSDSTFKGARGKAVGQGQLTAAAVSTDRKWLIVGTKEDGIGIYHLPTRRWLQMEKAFYQQLPSSEITHLAFSLDHFWMGGPKGLASMQVDEVNGPVTGNVNLITEVNGSIMDMDVDQGGKLWVLERRDCNTKGSKCIRLSRFNSAFSAPEALLEESNIFPNLTLADLHFARYWASENRLLVAGSAGVYSYDTRKHNWERHYRGAAQACLLMPDGEEGFYFGITGGIGVVSEQYKPWENKTKKCKTWMLPGSGRNEKIIAMHRGRKDEVLAMGLSGKVFSLNPSLIKDNIQMVLAGHRTPVSPASFHSAVSFGDTVLFVSANRALLHDFAARTYTTIPLSTLPDWLKRPGLVMKSSGDRVFATVMKKGYTHIYQLSRANAAAGRFNTASLLAAVPGVTSHIRDWGGKGIGLIEGSGSGRVFRFYSGKEQLTGSSALGMDRATLLDAAGFDNGVAFATSEGLRVYDYHTRGWGRNLRIPGLSTPREVARYDDRVFACTESGRLMELDSNRQLLGLISGDWKFDMADNQVSDVMRHKENLYLAGNGRINRYDTGIRSVTDRWRPTGGGEVKLKGIVKGEPLSLSNGRAYLGNRPLDRDAGPVLNISTDDLYIWTVRRKPGDRDIRYLKRYLRDDPFSLSTRCYFYNPASGSSTRSVVDAAEVVDGVIAVSTDRGLRFYDPGQRSWFLDVENDPLPRGGRIVPYGKYMLMVSESGNNTAVTIVAKDVLRVQLDCPPVKIHIPKKPRTVRAYTIDKSSEQLAVISHTGAVTQWHGTVDLEILGAPKDIPVSSRLKRAFLFNLDDRQSLSFTDSQRPLIHRYDLEKRKWSTLPLVMNLKNDALEEVNCQLVGYYEQVLAKTRNSNFYMGQMDLLAIRKNNRNNRAVDIKMKPLLLVSRDFMRNGAQIRDVQLRGGNGWTFVLKDGIKYYDPVQRRWQQEVKVPGNVGQFYQWHDRGVMVSADKKTWWVAEELGPQPTEFASYKLKGGEEHALDDKGTIWNLKPDGTLYHMPASGGTFKTPSVAYERPWKLDGTTVQAAYQWEKRIILDTTDGIKVFDTVLHQQMRLSRGVNQQKGIKEIYGDGNRVWIHTGSDRLLVLVYSTSAESGLNSNLFPGRISDLKTRVLEVRGTSLGTAPKLLDQWRELKKRLVKLADGSQVYDPIIGLAVDSSGQLVARRTVTQELLAPLGIRSFKTLPTALDAGWLRWDRSSGSFVIETGDTEISMKADAFVRNGKMLFEGITAVLVSQKNKLYAANSRGIFTHQGQSLDLMNPDISFRAMNWNPPTGAVHGVFITPDALWQMDENDRPLPRSLAVHRVQLGDVTLEENIRRGGVKGRIKNGKNPFAGRGFSWDSNRRGLGFTSRQLMVHSDAGLHPAKGYTGFESVPDGGTGQGKLVSQEAGVFLYQRGNAWYERTAPSKWKRAAGNLATDRTLVDNRTWTWKKKRGQLEITLKNQNLGFRANWTNYGLRFTSDVLKDAVSFDNRLAVITNGFMEIADQGANQAPDLYNPRFGAPGVRVDRLMVKGDSAAFDLVLVSGNRHLIWNDTTHKFINFAAGAAQQRDGSVIHYPVSPTGDASHAVLRFTLKVSAGGRRSVKKEVKVNDISGNRYWVAFNFVNGHFPFDMVTSLASYNPKAGQPGRRELYVGTMAGLQVYRGFLDFGLHNMSNCYQLRNGSRGRLTPVATVGIPADNRDLLRAYAPGMCIEKQFSTNTAFSQCLRPIPLNRRWRYGENDEFWKMTIINGKLDARYRDAAGKFSAVPIRADLGRLPHDKVRDLAVYKGEVFYIWRNGWISRHNEDSMELKMKDVITNYNTSDIWPSRFIEVPLDLHFSDSTAVEGLYIEGVGRTLWRYDGGNPTKPWQQINNKKIITELMKHANRPYIVNRKQLRMLALSKQRPGYGTFNFEIRTADGEWKILPWKNGHLAIDEWTEFIYANNSLWAATSEGLVRFSRGRGKKGKPDNIVLDPDRMMVIREPLINKKMGTITDIKADGQRVTIRCGGKSEQVYQGNVNGPYNGKVFRLLSAIKDDDNKNNNDNIIDPFDKQLLVSRTESGFWEWKLEGHNNFNPGELKAKWHGETIQLIGGRFSFDTVNSVAFFKDRQVEIGTDSGGWYRAPDSGFNLPDLKRPRVSGVNAIDIKEVRSSRDRKGERILGLRSSGRTFIRINEEGISGQTKEFPQFLDSDGFWRYMKDDSGSGLSILAGRSSGSSGFVKRKMENGRFSDDIVLGLPISSTDVEGNHYLLPTGAGIIRLDGELRPSDIYNSGAAAAGTKSATVPVKNPSVLYLDSRPSRNYPLYLADKKFMPVAIPSTRKQLFPKDLPRAYAPLDAAILAIEDGPQDYIRVRWQKSDKRGWTLLNPDTNRLEEDNSLYINLTKFDKYVSNRNDWAGVQPWMRVRFTDTDMEFLLQNSARPYRLPIPGKMEVTAVLVNKESLILIGRSNLYKIDLEDAMQKAKDLLGR